MDEPLRPRTRGDCVDGPRPCPWTTCRYHLAGDVGRAFRKAGGEALQTCALDVADEGGATLNEVGAILGVSRERIRQIENRAVAALRRSGRAIELAPDACPPNPPQARKNKGLRAKGSRSPNPSPRQQDGERADGAEMNPVPLTGLRGERALVTTAPALRRLDQLGETRPLEVGEDGADAAGALQELHRLGELVGPHPLDVGGPASGHLRLDSGGGELRDLRGERGDAGGELLNEKRLDGEHVVHGFDVSPLAAPRYVIPGRS